MTKVKRFSHFDEGTTGNNFNAHIDEQINEWLSTIERYIEIIDIKFAINYGEMFYETALVIYDTN